MKKKIKLNDKWCGQWFQFNNIMIVARRFITFRMKDECYDVQHISIVYICICTKTCIWEKKHVFHAQHSQWTQF